MSKQVFGLLVCLLVSSCASRPPASSENLCKIFTQKPNWYKAASQAAKKWGGNLYVPMAIMYQESGFNARAKPARRFFLGVIPRGRPSNAYGYPQALNSTWANYQREAGSRLSRRSDFSDSIDFIQWYMHKTAGKNKIPKTDAYRHYLNYHEGQGGYARGSHKNKKWLLNVARKVEQRSNRYARQLKNCRAKLERKRRWLF